MSDIYETIKALQTGAVLGVDPFSVRLIGGLMRDDDLFGPADSQHSSVAQHPLYDERVLRAISPADAAAIASNPGPVPTGNGKPGVSGVLNPVTVVVDTDDDGNSVLTVVAGRGRTLRVRHANKHGNAGHVLPVRLRDAETAPEDMVAENIMIDALDNYGRLSAVYRLYSLGRATTQAAIAKAIGKSGPQAGKYLRLCKFVAKCDEETATKILDTFRDTTDPETGDVTTWGLSISDAATAKGEDGKYVFDPKANPGSVLAWCVGRRGKPRGAPKGAKAPLKGDEITVDRHQRAFTSRAFADALMVQGVFAEDDVAKELATIFRKSIMNKGDYASEFMAWVVSPKSGYATLYHAFPKADYSDQHEAIRLMSAFILDGGLDKAKGRLKSAANSDVTDAAQSAELTEEA